MRQGISWTRLCAGLFMVLGMVAVTAPASAAGTGCLPASIKTKLNLIRVKFGPVRIVSTHRRGARIAGTGKRSYHASCRAVDFYAPKGKYRQVVSWLKSTHAGGVGTYSCGMHHIHIDNGGRVRFHKCVNGRGARVGKKRRYASKKRNKRYSGKSRKRSKKYASKKSYKKSYKKAVVRVARAPSPGGRITAYSH